MRAHGLSQQCRCLQRRKHVFPSGRASNPTIAPCRSTKNDDKSSQALSTLDQLLGQADAAPGSVNGAEAAPQTGWPIRPKQTAPPRRTAMSPSSGSGRFLANESIFRSSEVSVGGKTLLGQGLELPKVAPGLSYVLAAVNAVAYVALVQVSYRQGPEAASELLAALLPGGAQDTAASHGELSELVASCVLNQELAPLALTLYGMMAVAPHVEAAMGYPTFLAIYALSGVTATIASLLVAGGSGLAAAGASAAAAAGGSETVPSLLAPLLQPLGSAGELAVVPGAGGAVFGLLGCALVHELRNSAVENRGARAAGAGATRSDATASASSSSSSSSNSSSLRKEGSVPRGPLAELWGSRQGTAASALAVAAGTLSLSLMAAQGTGADHAVQSATATSHTAGLAAGFLSGAALAWRMGPEYSVLREAYIPDGSMYIPEDVEEVEVVINRTTTAQRWVAAAAYCSLLAAGVGALGLLPVSG